MAAIEATHVPGHGVPLTPLSRIRLDHQNHLLLRERHSEKIPLAAAHWRPTFHPAGETDRKPFANRNDRIFVIRQTITPPPIVADPPWKGILVRYLPILSSSYHAWLIGNPARGR
jgi:hypothetical protein